MVRYWISAGRLCKRHFEGHAAGKRLLFPNVWMEEGVFRGLFIQTISETKSFMSANLIAAVLFGIWHIVMPFRSFITGEMSFPAAVFMGIGYMILSGIMAAQLISFLLVLIFCCRKNRALIRRG